MKQGFARKWIGLHYAAYFNDASEIHRQIRNGADVDARTSDGRTALHMACSNGNSKCIEAILKYDPYLDSRENTDRMTPLIMLLKHKECKSSILKTLLDMGADPNVPQNDGETPLHIITSLQYQCKREALRNAHILLKYKVNVNAKNVFRESPLQKALMSGFKEIIPVLIRNGARVTIDCLKLSPFKCLRHLNGTFKQPFFEFGMYFIIQICIKKIDNDELLEKICEYEFLKLFKDKCDEELSELKRSITDETNVTYYDLLVLRQNTVTKYLKNEDILNSVMAFDKHNSIFGDELSRVIEDAKRRNEALEIGYTFFKNSFTVNLPVFCLDLIFEYLSNKDLRQLKMV